MNLGIILGCVTRGSTPVNHAVAQLTFVEGSSDTSVGRGVDGQPRGIRLYTYNERPVQGTELARDVNRHGCFLIPFRWDFLGSGGLPNDIFPFIHLRLLMFSGSTSVPNSPNIRQWRFRGHIRNTPSTFLDLSGVNVPVESVGATSMAIDCANIWRRTGVGTLPNPLIGQTVIESRMLVGAVTIGV